MGTTSGGDGDRPWQSYHTVYTNAKAGMDGVDKEKVQKIVYEMSKGSKYYENELRREAYMKQKIDLMRAQCAKLTENDISHFQMIAHRKILELEASRDLSKIWLHSDMDAFYAAVETLENPSLKRKPLAVGNMSMICTANYEARKFGVRAAMPGFIARKLCPDLIFVPTNFEKYTYYSGLTRKVFSKYDANFIATSLDEAYLDITDACKEKGLSSEEIAKELRNAIYEETGLTCSAGVAPNRVLAKVCSDINKPNGQFILPNDKEAVVTFVSSLPIRKIGGIGKVTEHVLKDVLGINTCDEMLQKSAFLCALFSDCSFDFFLSAGLGLGGTDTPESKLRKSISSERTFSSTDDESFLYQKLAEIAETLSNDMLKECLQGRTLTLKLKTAAFEVRTRAATLQRYIQAKEDILRYATKLLKPELPLSLRLIGLRMSQFRDDRHGSGDPMQKPLTSFVTSRNPSSLTVCDDTACNSVILNNDLVHATNETDLTVCSEISLSSELNNSCISFGSNGSVETLYLNCEHEDNSKDACPMRKNRTEEVPYKSETKDLEHNNGNASFSENEIVLSSNLEEQVFWVDDYICSLCGIELPPSFIEERQEHLDYHVAVKLQNEETLNNSSAPIRKESFVLRSLHTRGSARKRKKSSPKDSKFLPIDSFFIKSNKS